MLLRKQILPAKARNQHTDNEGAQQTSNSKDGHSERVHERQGLPTESCPITTHNRFVVETLYVLEEQSGSEVSDQNKTAH